MYMFPKRVRHVHVIVIEPVEEFTTNATVALCFVLHCHLYAILYSRKRETYAFDNCDRLRDMFLVIVELLRRTRMSSFL